MILAKLLGYTISGLFLWTAVLSFWRGFRTAEPDRLAWGLLWLVLAFIFAVVVGLLP